MAHAFDDWIDEHTADPADGAKHLDAESGARRDALREQQVRESAEAWAGPGVPMMTDATWKGFLLGAVVGGVIGALLLSPFSLIEWGNASFVVRLAVFMIIGAVGGGTAGALYWGGRAPELDNELIDADGRPSVGTTLRNPNTDERGR